MPFSPSLSSGEATLTMNEIQLDPLRDCLLSIARSHGIMATVESLSAGLPLTHAAMTPTLFVRAARRVGLACRVLRQPLSALRPELLPAVLLLNGDQACLLHALDQTTGVARVCFPELANAEVDISLSELETRYSGLLIFVRPQFKFERRAPELSDVRSRHWFWQTLRGGWPLYRDALLAALLINLCALVVPLVSMNVYDRVVPNMATSTLWVLALGAGMVLAFDFLLKISRAYLLDLAGKRVDITLSTLIMERVLGLRLEGRPASVGAFAANLRAFETVRDFIASSSVVTLVDLPFVLIFLLVMAWLSPWFTLPVLVCGSLMLLQAWLAQDKMKELSESTLRAAAQRNAMLVESLTALETIKAMSAEGPQQARWEQSTLFLAQVGARLKILSALTTHFAGFMQQLVYIATLVLGVYLIMDGHTSQGGIIAAAMLSSRASAPLGQLVSLLTQYHNARTSLSSLEGIMKLPVEREPGVSYFPRAPFKGEIEFRNLSLHYPNAAQAALSNVSFKIRAGERVAIVGAVGSGKSTIEKLVLGLYQPSEGAVLIDGCDIKQIDPTELRRHIGYMPQDTLLFYGSLRQNLMMAAPHAHESQLLSAVEIAGLAPFINNHPQGFDMLVGERGETLSGGQRRAVGIARALVGDPSILVMDEPTSNMDAPREAQIKQSLRQAVQGKTLLLVTHQPALLELVERVIVLDRGRVVMDGPKRAVLEALQGKSKAGRAE
jgi:ATP-binding cassette subfamily C protein LapB